MGKKVVETWMCDDCGVAINKPFITYKEHDLCEDCVRSRLYYSLNYLPWTIPCPMCDGKGKIKEKDQCVVQYGTIDWEECDFCKGKGRVNS